MVTDRIRNNVLDLVKLEAVGEQETGNLLGDYTVTANINFSPSWTHRDKNWKKGLTSFIKLMVKNFNFYSTDSHI